jgi:hypothetical protein
MVTPRVFRWRTQPLHKLNELNRGLRVSSETRFAFCFAKLDAKRVSLFRKTNWLFREISCFAKQSVLHVSLFLGRSYYLRDNPIFTSVYDNYSTTSVAGPHHFYAAPAPIKNFDAVLDPAAPAPTLLYS